MIFGILNPRNVISTFSLDMVQVLLKTFIDIQCPINQRVSS
uniref:Uncharacterized protein n=1 Tax=Lepeophtheirus salmonis TaxID=72036 RepID=A0A0K2T1Y2_LEPSM